MSKNSLSTIDRGPRQTPQIYLDPDPGFGYEFQGSEDSETQKKRIQRFLYVLRRYWLLIFATTFVVTALVLIYEAQKPDFYVANAKVQVNNETNPAVGGTGGGSIVLSQGSDPAYFATQLRILEGTGLLRRVVETVDLEHNPAFWRPAVEENSVWQNVLRVVGLAEPIRPSEEDEANVQKTNNLNVPTDDSADPEIRAEKLAPYVEAVKSGLIVAPVKESRTASKETRMIDVIYRHTDPVIATKVTNAIADLYVLQNLERKVESNATASEFLDKRVAELQNQIRSSEERLINYSRNNQIVSLDSGQNTVVQRLADLNMKLGQAESERISAEAAYLAAKQNPMSGAVAEAADPRTGTLETQLTGLRQQLALLKTEYTDEWPEVKRVQRQIAQIETELRTNKRRATDTQASILEQKYREALARENELRNNFASQKNSVLAQNEAAINYRIIQQEIDSNRTLLASLLARSRETDVILNGTPNNVIVADRAMVPQSPSGPQRTKTIFIAFIASLFAGIGLAFVAGWLDDRIRVFDDIEEKVGLPVFGKIPSIREGRMRQLASFVKPTNGDRGGPLALTAGVEQPVFAEAFNEVRASLLLAAENGAPRTILVTSGEANEGKTLTSFNLAKCLAQLGSKVLLIDADLRCPQLHHIIGTNNKTGLTSLLMPESDNQREVVDLAITENISANLDLMTAGPVVADPATLLSLNKFKEVIENLGASYSYIVIDSPPTLYFADSMLLAAAVDSVLIVGRINCTSTELLKLSRRRLENVNANVVGVVLNDIPLSQYWYSSYDYYTPKGITPNQSNGMSGGSKLLDI